MAKFEAFLRPEGAGSRHLAGRTSLDARWQHQRRADYATPAGEESAPPEAGTLAAVSRIIIIEDADYLGHARQSYLRRMMESSRSAFLLPPTHHHGSLKPSVVEPNTFGCLVARLMIEQRLEAIATEEQLVPASGVLGDIAHVASGNLRKSIFTLQLLAQRNLLASEKTSNC